MKLMRIRATARRPMPAAKGDESPQWTMQVVARRLVAQISGATIRRRHAMGASLRWQLLDGAAQACLAGRGRCREVPKMFCTWGCGTRRLAWRLETRRALDTPFGTGSSGHRNSAVFMVGYSEAALSDLHVDGCLCISKACTSFTDNLPDTKMLNVVLVRLHQFFFVLVLIATVGVTMMADSPRIIILDVLLLALATAHWYAVKGARLGRSDGRTSSRIMGVFWLLGFPIGTILAIFVFINTDKRHWQACADSSVSSAPAARA